MSLPLGLRLNNPGNLRPSDPPWRGQVGEESGFCKFDTLVNGIRALCKNLLAYQRHDDGSGGKIDTVREAISRWAPPADHNDTEAYIAFVCHVLECNDDDRFDFRDADFLFWMVVAIGSEEQGGNAFSTNVSDSDIDEGVMAALTT